MLDVVMTKPKLILHIVGRAEYFFHPFVHWNKGAILTLALYRVHVLAYHCPTFHGRVGWQSCNVWIGTMVLNLLKRCGMRRTILTTVEDSFYACHFCPSAWTSNEIVHFVRLIGVVISIGWQVELPFGGPKQFWALQYTTMVSRSFSPDMTSWHMPTTFSFKNIELEFY